MLPSKTARSEDVGRSSIESFEEIRESASMRDLACRMSDKRALAGSEAEVDGIAAWDIPEA